MPVWNFISPHLYKQVVHTRCYKESTVTTLQPSMTAQTNSSRLFFVHNDFLNSEFLNKRDLQMLKLKMNSLG